LEDGRFELRLKRPWRDGTTAFVYTPHELLERLGAIVPRPRAHLTPVLWRVRARIRGQTLALLGVDERCRGRGLGTKLFARALADALRAFETVRFVAVIVDPLTDANAAFYASHGFSPIPGTPNRLFLPATTFVEIVER
jgi:GNAT superfamily N-acetyltransferase